MPYLWTEPDVFLSHQGVDVYVIYPDDCADAPPREHWFGFDPACSDGGDAGSFDLRDVAPLLPEAIRAPCGGDSHAVLTALIDAGVLTAEGCIIDGVLCTEAERIRAAASASIQKGGGA